MTNLVALCNYLTVLASFPLRDGSTYGKSSGLLIVTLSWKATGNYRKSE